MQIELNENQKTEIVSRVIAALQTNSVAISDLTQVSTVSSSDYIEVSGGKRIAVSAIIDAVIAAIGGGGGGGGGDENVIEDVQVNGQSLPVNEKAVNINSIPASIVSDDASHRFVSDTEKSAWNGKANKPSSATNGHLAGLNGQGNLTDSGFAIMVVTQAYYDGLTTPDANTIYLITES